MKQTLKNSVIPFIIGAALSYLAFERAPVVPQEQPEQSYYVLFLEVCGRFEYLTALTDGKQSPWSNRDVPASDELLELMLNVDGDKIVSLSYWDNWCPKPPEKT